MQSMYLHLMQASTTTYRKTTDAISTSGIRIPKQTRMEECDSKLG